MKWLPALLITLVSFAALAAEDQPKPLAATPKPGIVIINGKKFFPMQNARHFTGSGLSPSAMGVVHHPRPQAPIVTRGTQSTKEQLPMTESSESSVKTETAEPSQVLSVFAPEENMGPAAAPTK